MPLKIVVTNVSALQAKYKAAGVAEIRAAINKMVAADKKRGLTTRLIAVDDAAAMKRVKGAAVAVASNPRQNKEAIDAIYTALAPDYLMILGSVDVIPYQDLTNPLFDPGGDDDQYASGDLPYACEAGYSREIADFVGPTRVVGRLPDLTAGTNPLYLANLITSTAGWTSGVRDDYLGHLGMSAYEWRKSTDLSLKNLFGSAAVLNTSPAAGPNWKVAEIGTMTHFINCHGGTAYPHFLGQKGSKYPEAHNATYVLGKIRRGTIAAAECCYGTELYDPQKANGVRSICNAYLECGAYAFFGSSTTAYGPASGNSDADLLCQYFIRDVMDGASTGRAALMARQEFLRASGTLDPYELKTLAQFSLIGDPSVHPVARPEPRVMLPSGAPSKGFEAAAVARDGLTSTANLALKTMANVTSRRTQLLKSGLALGRLVSCTTNQKKQGVGAVPARIREAFDKVAKARKLPVASYASFGVRAAKGIGDAAGRLSGKAKALVRSTPQRIHTAVAVVKAKNLPKGRQVYAMVASEDTNGNVVVRQLLSR